MADNKPISQEVLDRFMDISVDVTVELGSTEMPLRDVMNLAPGSLVELNRKADEPVNLYVNRKLVATGEVVVVENSLGIKITSVTNAPEGGEAPKAETAKVEAPKPATA
jgi:flagellar motor switch protein FliN